ncbi:hypothetical protein B0H15DRAFT_932659 [Mycena belliarum]|uniref:Uncharacterized protein n=1 Tax=Mycena belliarum TaxID=1033014 RepID=A0AAD6XLF1_9AGAR|nr:hypothetical protein B0H15DRAFT_932659 [Mycena belliae]
MPRPFTIDFDSESVAFTCTQYYTCDDLLDSREFCFASTRLGRFWSQPVTSFQFWGFGSHSYVYCLAQRADLNADSIQDRYQALDFSAERLEYCSRSETVIMAVHYATTAVNDLRSPQMNPHSWNFPLHGLPDAGSEATEAQWLVVAKSGSEIGSNLNRTEPDARSGSAFEQEQGLALAPHQGHRPQLVDADRLRALSSGELDSPRKPHTQSRPRMRATSCVQGVWQRRSQCCIQAQSTAEQSLEGPRMALRFRRAVEVLDIANGRLLQVRELLAKRPIAPDARVPAPRARCLFRNRLSLLVQRGRSLALGSRRKPHTQSCPRMRATSCVRGVRQQPLRYTSQLRSMRRESDASALPVRVHVLRAYPLGTPTAACSGKPAQVLLHGPCTAHTLTASYHQPAQESSLRSSLAASPPPSCMLDVEGRCVQFGVRTRVNAEPNALNAERAFRFKVRHVPEPDARQPSSNAASAPGRTPFTLPVDLGYTSLAPTNRTDFGQRFLAPDLFPAASIRATGQYSQSWLPQFSHEASMPGYGNSGQPAWDDFGASFDDSRSIPTRPPSTDSDPGDFFEGYNFHEMPTRPSSSSSQFFDDGYGIDALMDEIRSAPASSIYSEDAGSSRYCSSHDSRPVSVAPLSIPGSPPSVSVEIQSWDGTDWRKQSPQTVFISGPEHDLAGEAPDMDSRLGWAWKPSGLKWLDDDVTSEVVEFPAGINLTDKQKVYAVHRVKGCPSQFPFYRKRTAFLVDFTTMHDLPADATVDQLIRSQDSHSYGGSTGSRNGVDAKLPGSFFGLSGEEKISCRRATPSCSGVVACESLDPVFLNEERRELDPEPAAKLVAATLRTREMQDDTDVGRTLAFYHSLQRWHCNGVRADGERCDGSISVRKLRMPDRGKNHILLCSKREDALMASSFHSQARILDHVPEDLLLRAMSGEPIHDAPDTEDKCPRVVSGRTGGKGKAQCPFNHHKGGLPYIAKVRTVSCSAKMHIFCPSESLHPELARMAVVVPSPASGHTHPPPPANKCTPAVAERYRECVRRIGLGATVAKVENAETTKALLDGKTPGLFHPGLISRDTKTRLVQQVKAELNGVPGDATGKTTRQQVASYLSEQETLSDEKRFLHSSISRDGKRIIFGAHHKLLCFIHHLRTLDCDTTFKPVAGEMQIFEINGWLAGIKESITVLRVWMEVHDRAAYKAVWEEILRLVLKLTRKQLKFKGLHKGGKVLGLNSDMEAAPLLGLADAFAPTVDIESHLLLYILRLCYTHYNRGVPELLHLSPADRKRISDVRYLKTPEEVEVFKVWIPTLPDPQGVIKRMPILPLPWYTPLALNHGLGWWDHKLMHRWLLPGFIHCLSKIPLEQWNTMEATTNLGEAQHAWNNSQTGISMGIIESFRKYEELDIRRAQEIEGRMSTGLSRNSGNEVTDRFADRTARRTRALDKGKRAHVADATVVSVQAELSETKEELKAARADAKAERSDEATGRVRELEHAVNALAEKLKLAKAEAKSNSSGRAQPKRGAAAPIATVASDQANSPQPAPDAPTAHATPTSISAPIPQPTSDTVVGASTPRRTSRKRPNPHSAVDTSSLPGPSSGKRQKTLTDPLANWEMEDPDTKERLTGHEWVRRFPNEFERCYKKTHRDYVNYLAQSATV